jgi:DNA-binding Lrp family transcriptional regulator
MQGCMAAQQEGVWIRRNNLKPLCRFYLINPERNASVNSTVKKLIGISEVDEVYVTEGEYGFMVKAKASSQKITSSISQRFSGRVGVMTSYARYRK